MALAEGRLGVNWKLTQQAIGESQVEDWSDQDHEDLTLGYTLLRALAESDHTLVEIAPGVWRHSQCKDPDGAYWLPKAP
jgi:hypothetical protein